MLLLVFILFITSYETQGATIADKILEIDNTVMDIYNKPEENQAPKFIETIQLYITTMNKTTDEFKQSDKNIDEYKKLRSQGRAEFLLHGIKEDKIEQFQKVFKWTEEQVKDYIKLMREAEDAWGCFIYYFFGYLVKKGYHEAYKRSFKLD